MSAPLLGHLDPAFVAMMDDVKAMLRTVFATGNALTLPISGTGSAGMEACLVNLLEPGDEIVVGVNGVFGTRMTDVAERCGAVVRRVEAPWGRVVRAELIFPERKRPLVKSQGQVELPDAPVSRRQVTHAIDRTWMGFP